ncbi:BglG family transcription antiterminator [Mycetocola reblochoni]|nr:PTS sugar transporter subunit IIA [Mycetocola reblochoni]
MARSRRAQVLTLLTEAGTWLPAASIADALGVSTRSVRGYVQSLRDDDGHGIESGAAGYRLRSTAAAPTAAPTGDVSPEHRATRLLRDLLRDAAGVDVADRALTEHLSGSTMEADLARVRQRLENTGLRLERSGSRVRLAGPEHAQRLALLELFRAESVTGEAPLDSALGSVDRSALAKVKTAILAGVDAVEHRINEYGLDDFLLHLAVAADRAGGADSRSAPTAAPVTRTPPVAPPSPESSVPPVAPGQQVTPDPQPTPALVGRIDVGALIRDELGIELPPADVDHLARVLSTRAVTAEGTAGDADTADALPGTLADTVGAIVASLGREYGLDLADPGFLRRLTAHVANLVERSADASPGRNPLAATMKTSYPMIYDVAVRLSGAIADATGITVGDDEIAYIALHLGAQLNRSLGADARLPITVIAPGYLDLYTGIVDGLLRRFGDDVRISTVVTRTDVPWGELDDPLVISAAPLPQPRPGVVTLPPFPDHTDWARVADGIARARTRRARDDLMAQLRQRLPRELFVPGFVAADRTEAIRSLGSLLIQHGIVDDGYVASAIERERLSSTLFAEGLAVPHAMGLTARRTALAVAVSPDGVRWGDDRARLVVFLAISPTDREQFQSLFDRLVELFADPTSLGRVVRSGTDYDAFLSQIEDLFDA